jgi:MFS family permease
LVVLALGAALMSQVRNVALLALCIFLLRHGGQGLMSHISVTSMARYFEAGRGRAIALASVGFAAGEALLPMTALILIERVGWRWSFGSVAIVLLLLGAPLVFWLLRGHEKRHTEHLRMLAEPVLGDAAESRSWTRREVLHDPRFYLLLPGLLAPAMIVTALFFTHLSLADAKGWSHAWVTGSYAIYAGATTVVALFCGPLIDRFGGTRLVPVMLLPMAVALLVAGTMRQPWAVWPYFCFLGLSIGISQTAVSAMWAELYGVGSIGAIKSVVTALAVLASAIGPVIMGVCLDHGISIEQVCLSFAGYVLAASVLLWIALRAKAAPSTA